MSGLTRIDSYGAAEKAWRSVLNGPASHTIFTTHQWQKTWWNLFGDGAEMMMLCMNSGDKVEAIAPLSRRDGAISFIGSQDLNDYGDFLVAPGSELHFYDSLLEFLGGESWDAIRLSSLGADSPTLAHLPELAQAKGYSVHIEEEDVAPRVKLPPNWEDYLALLSKKDRHELRRKLRRLESAHDDLAFRVYSTPEDVEANLEDFFPLMRKSKQEKRRFLTPERERFFRHIARETAEMGAFRLFFLELDGVRTATAICFDYRNARHLYNSGYDPDYSYYSVSLALKAMCVRDAIESGLECFDFLRGPEPYKYDLGAKDTTIYQLTVTRS